MNPTARPISILYAIDGIEFGGGERTFLQLIKGLPKEKFKTQVVTSCDGAFYEIIKDSDITIHHVDFRKQLSLDNLRQLSKLVEQEKIDIIHSQGSRVDFYARLSARMCATSVRVVNTIAMPVEGYDVSPLRKRLYSFFDSFSERYVDRFIVVSETLRNKMIYDHKIPADRVIKIYNGIEIEEYQPQSLNNSSHHVREKYGLGNNDILIGAIGRMVWQKGFEYLINGAKEVIHHNSKTKILMVGDGPLREKLEKLVRDLGINNNVIFTGFRSDIKDILCAVDVLVVPSVLEGFPMVTLEAMAMAKPIVATCIDGIKEQIADGIEGILVPPRDSTALAIGIKRILEDKELTRSLGSTARKKVEEEFSLEKMISETEALYNTLIERQSKQPESQS